MASVVMRFAGAVLTGGESTRMGTDKAFVAVEGIPMCRRVAMALATAGAHPVLAIGGDEGRLRELGFRVVPDRHPGTGPLGGLLTALEAATSPVLVVAPCDQPWLDGATVDRLVEGLEAAPHAGAAVFTLGTHRQPLPAALRTGVARRPLLDAFERGERSLLGGLRHVAVAEVASPGPGRLRDVDRPEDLPDHV